MRSTLPMQRPALVAAIGLLATLLPFAAHVSAAGATTVVSKNPTGSVLRIGTQAGDRNDLGVYTTGPASDRELQIVERGRDLDGMQLQIDESAPGCRQEDFSVYCSADGIRRIRTGLGSRRDLFGVQVDPAFAALGLRAIEATGGPQADSLFTHIGSDFPKRPPPPFLYSGDTGDDWLLGADGPDVLTGGLGADRFHGLSGDDQIRAADGAADESIDCGPGSDTLELDVELDPTPVDC